MEVITEFFGCTSSYSYILIVNLKKKQLKLQEQLMKEKLMALEADPASISQDMFESKIHYENKITALEKKVAALDEDPVFVKFKPHLDHVLFPLALLPLVATVLPLFFHKALYILVNCCLFFRPSFSSEAPVNGCFISR